MKKIITIIFILFSLFSFAFADGTRILDSETKVISAYKLSSTSGQEPVLTIRLMDGNNAEFEASEILVTPLEARDNDYAAFSWVLGGNVYRGVTLSFSFGPMWKEGLQSTNKNIPYKMTLTHISSKVGNSVLACNKASVSLPVDFLGYEFRYADSVNYPAAVTVNKTAQTATVSYDMGTSYTTVTRNGNSANYTGIVCSYWNRMGLATIHLQINEDGVPTASNTALPDGMYYSTVVITITMGT